MLHLHRDEGLRTRVAEWFELTVLLLLLLLLRRSSRVFLDVVCSAIASRAGYASAKKKSETEWNP